MYQSRPNHNFRLDICPSSALVDQLKFQVEQADYPMPNLQVIVFGGLIWV